MDVPSVPNIIYRNFVSVQKIEVRLMFSNLYRMSKDGVYPSSVLSCPFFVLSIARHRRSRFNIRGSRGPL